MAGYRIRRGTQEFPVSDLDSLVKLARDGRLVPEDPVLVGEEWVRADSLAALRPHLGADPWSIWENAERLDAEAVYRAALAAGEQVADLTDEQLRPLMVLEAKSSEAPVAPQTDVLPPTPAPVVAPQAAAAPDGGLPLPEMSWNPPPPPSPGHRTRRQKTAALNFPSSLAGNPTATVESRPWRSPGPSAPRMGRR